MRSCASLIITYHRRDPSRDVVPLITNISSAMLGRSSNGPTATYLYIEHCSTVWESICSLLSASCTITLGIHGKMFEDALVRPRRCLTIPSANYLPATRRHHAPCPYNAIR